MEARPRDTDGSDGSGSPFGLVIRTSFRGVFVLTLRVCVPHGC